MLQARSRQVPLSHFHPLAMPPTVGSAQDIQARQVAFAYCKHAKRRYMVVLREGEEPPPELAHAPHGRQRAVEQLTLMLQQGGALAYSMLAGPPLSGCTGRLAQA